MNPADVKKILQYALDKEHYGECICMTLVLFCGVRKEEAGKLFWNALDFDHKTVSIEAGVAKGARRRTNEIPPNAWEWIKESMLGDPLKRQLLVPKNYTNRLRAIRTAAGVAYSQNAMRHSFASYHVGQQHSADRTALLMGHPNATLLFTTYRDVVSPDVAAKYWQVYPDAFARAKTKKSKEHQKQVEAMLAD